MLRQAGTSVTLFSFTYVLTRSPALSEFAWTMAFRGMRRLTCAATGASDALALLLLKWSIFGHHRVRMPRFLTRLIRGNPLAGLKFKALCHHRGVRPKSSSKILSAPDATRARMMRPLFFMAAQNSGVWPFRSLELTLTAPVLRSSSIAPS